MDLQTFNIKFIDKLRYIDGHDIHVFSDKIFQCRTSLSTKESIKLVKNVTQAIAENNGMNVASTVSHVKNFIVENSETSDYIDTLELSREIFPSSEFAQKEFVKQIKEVGVQDTVSLPKALLPKSEKSQKIKTDTGVEIIFPVDYFHNKDMIEFINNPDGTLSIQIKNINKIINK